MLDLSKTRNKAVTEPEPIAELEPDRCHVCDDLLYWIDPAEAVDTTGRRLCQCPRCGIIEVPARD